MITGDHVETAVNVARTCNLLKNTNIQLSLTAVDCKSFNLFSQKVSEIAKKIAISTNEKYSNINYALVIDGDALSFVLRGNTFLQTNFLHIVGCCEVVIACRASPSQKAQLVNIVKVLIFSAL